MHYASQGEEKVKAYMNLCKYARVEKDFILESIFRRKIHNLHRTVLFGVKATVRIK